MFSSVGIGRGKLEFGRCHFGLVCSVVGALFGQQFLLWCGVPCRLFWIVCLDVTVRVCVLWQSHAACDRRPALTHCPALRAWACCPVPRRSLRRQKAWRFRSVDEVVRVCVWGVTVSALLPRASLPTLEDK